MDKPKSESVPQVVKWMHEHLLIAHLDLAEYKRIYTSNPEDLDVLNSTAQLFFARLHRLYWSMFIQTAGRLMDPWETTLRGEARGNASLDRLVKEAMALPFHSKIQTLKEEADKEWKPLKPIRNRVVSHNDLEFVTSPSQKLNAQTVSIERIYSLAGECVKLYYSHFEDTGVSYDLWHSPGAASMLFYLKRGRDAWEVERQSLLARQP